MSRRRSSVRVCATVIAVGISFAIAPAFAASPTESPSATPTPSTKKTTTGGTGAADAAPNAVAFAHISSSGSVVSFGGSKTTSASAKALGNGDYQVTFTGTYGPSASTDNVIPLSTAESGNSAVSNAVVDSATKKELVIEVFAFDPSTEDDENNDVFVAVFRGQ